MLKLVKFAELPVTDQDRAVSFYTQKVGLRLAQDSSYQEGWRWIELDIPGAETRLMLTKLPPGDKPDTPRLVLIADDVDGTYRELASKGVIFTKQPSQAPWNPKQKFAQFRDSEGNGIVISSM
jgi:lactoylglutathione lyase